MKKTKEQKGITLIALIITIIVLLILAVVTINSIRNDGIINYAKNARDDYGQAQGKENDILTGYMGYLNNAVPTGSTGGDDETEDTTGKDDETEDTKGPWKQNGTIIINETDGTITLEVGDYVDYKSGVEGYTDENGWRVLGVDNGQILLISASNVEESLTLSGAEDYLEVKNGKGKLNDACEPYGKGNYASGARSVNVDDINRVTGYDPKNQGDGTRYGSGTLSEYENEVTYTLTEDGRIAYSGTNGVNGTSTYTSFTMPDENGTELTTALTAENPITLKSTEYYYYPNTLTGSSSGNTEGIATDSEAYKTIFKKADGTTNDRYWLGSSYVFTSTDHALFGVRYVYDGFVFGYHYLWFSTWGEDGYACGVRAAVYLESDVTLTSNGANSWTLPNA